MSHKYRSQRERPAWGASFLLLFYLLLCTATAGHCTAPNETRPTSKKIIAVIPPDAPPQYFRDETTGQASGISVDIMNEVARRGGFAVEYIFAGSWDLMEQAVLSKKADLVPNLTIDEKRLKSLIFTVPVETLKISLIARASDTVHNRIESGMKIGAMKESSVYHFLSKRDDVTLYPYPGLQPLLLDLLAGRVDLAVAPAPNMIKLARDANIEDRIRIIEPCLYEAKRGMALRPGNEALRDQLNTVINEFFATLAYQKLYQRWWGIPAPFWNTRRVTGTIAGVVTVLVTIFMVLRFRERRLTNEKLQKSEQKYRQFVETANEGVWAIDAEQRTTFVNRCMAEMLGYMPEEMLGKNVEIFIFDEDLPEHHARMDQRKQGHGGAYERRLRHKDGSEVWARVSATAIIDAENRFAGSHALFTDITQRKQAEKSLVIFKESLDNSADAIGMATVQGRHYYQNKAFSELFGTIGENPFNDVYVDKTIGEEVYRTIMSGQVWTGEVKLYAKDRKVLDFHLRAYATKDDSGNITNLVGIHTDISERKFAEKIIRRRERLLIGLNNAAQALLYSQDTIPFQKVIEQIGPASKADRASIFINHHGQEGNLSMRRIAEWCAKGIRSEIDNPLSRGVSYDEWLPRWKDALACGNIISGSVSNFSATERDILKSQGILSILVIPIMVEKEVVGFISFDKSRSDSEWDSVFQTYFQLAAFDIGEAIKRQRFEQQIRDSLREKEMLLREIHHRVKNNLQVILSLLRMHSRKTVDTHSGQVFNDCRDRIDAMSLIHESLYQSDDLARINFEDYLKKLCKNISRAYGGRDKGVAVMIAPCNVTLNMDQGVSLGMVISELISNAFKHAFPLGKGGNVLIHMDRLNEEEIELIISDNGKGLPPEINLQNPTSIGLRLVVAAVTRELSGSIKVERDGGTRFILRFAFKNG